MPSQSVLDFITLIIGEQYKSWSASFCNFHQSPVTSSHTQMHSSAPQSATPSVYVLTSMW
jgi:hypothetical protein